MFKQPDTNSIALKLETAIKRNTSPQRLFYDFLMSGSMEANYIRGQIAGNKQLLRLITSPAGRAWIKSNIDGFLNYLATLEQLI